MGLLFSIAGLVLGYLVGAPLAAMRSSLIIDDSGVYAERIGRTVKWQVISSVRLTGRELRVAVFEDPAPWEFSVDLSRLSASAKALTAMRERLQEKLAAPWPQAELAVDAPEYSVVVSQMPQLAAGSFVLVASSLLSIAVDPNLVLGAVLSPILFLAGMGAAALRPYVGNAGKLRASAYSFRPSGAYAIPWSAVSQLDFADSSKSVILVGLRDGGHRDHGVQVPQPTLEIDVTGAKVAPDSILAALRQLHAKATKVENCGKGPAISASRAQLSQTALAWRIGFALLLVVWGVSGVWYDDLALPTRSGALQLHGSAAWVMLIAFAGYATHLLAPVLGHFDKRGDEARHQRLRFNALTVAWIAFIAALAVKVAF